MNAPPDVTSRIFSVADALYEEAGRESFPTVDAVRKRAKVNMNDASIGMRAWRRSQMRVDEKLTVQVPEKIRASFTLVINALWAEAMDLASESLRGAQAGWAAEREESHTLAAQMASAFETQASELNEVKAENEHLVSERTSQSMEFLRVQKAHETAVQDLLSQRARAELAETRVLEIERRVEDLRGELRHSHAVADMLRQEVNTERLAHDAAVANWHSEFAELKAQAQREEKIALQALSEAKEINAMLQGRLDAIE